MKPSRIISFLWFASCTLLLSMAARAQQSITISNPGFELPAVAEEVFSQSPANWSAFNGTVMGGPSAEGYVYDPTAADFPALAPAQAPQGDNVAAIYVASGEKGIFQTLATIFQPGDSYQLIVKVGNTDAVTGFPGYRVQLVVNNTVLAEDNNTLTVTSGQFVTSTVNYAYDPAQDALLGQPLQIRLLSKGLANTEVAFDDVKLFAVLANPFASAGGPYYLPNPATSLSLNASASLPSGTASITAYDWDLDNDGQFDDATGVTPASISFATLRSVYGMVDGSNTVRVRITDSAAKTAIALGTVELVTSTKYTGVNGSNNDTWNTLANWDNGIPAGGLDVVILSGKAPMAWSNTTPTFTGNLTLQNNARMVIGWTEQRLASYNALGTPGLSKIIMNPGTSILTRMGGSPVIPEMQLLANAAFSLGTSTQTGAQALFNYPITGAYQLLLEGNGQGSCIANLNVSNGFSSLLASGSEAGLTIKGNASGSLGTGDVTLAQRAGSAACYAILEINAANAMADTGTLSISGTGATLLRMNANDTIAGFLLDGVQQPLGTYGSLSSSATNKRSWITGTGILTLAVPPVGYWDLNGTTVGAGGTSPTGTWNASNTHWNSNTAGTGSVSAWTPGHSAIFSAGTDATGTYSVNVEGTQDISGLLIRNGSVTLTLGASGALRLTSDSTINVVTGSTSIATPITESSARALSKSGSGTLTLSNNLSHTGGTSLLGGNLTLSGSNSSATGNTTVTSGVLRVDSSSAIPGTTRNVTINTAGKLVFGPAFGAGNIQTALNNRIVTTSAGTIAADNNASVNFDFSTAGLTAAYFGSLGNANYTGTLTPQGNAYRLTGEGGILTMANTNALTGVRTLTTRGNVVLAVGNNYSGATTVEANSSLSLLGSTGTSGITLNAGTTLTLGNNGSLGVGALTISGAATLNAVGTIVTTNAVAANADFVISGTGALTLGTTTINNNRIITNASTSTATFGSIIRDGTNNRNLSINGSGNTTVTGSLTLGTGTLTKNDGGTLTLQGSNTYGATTVGRGVLRLEGSLAGAATTLIDFGKLQLGSNSNGGLASGDITMAQSSSVIETVGADRSITNNIILNTNSVPTISGNFSLTVSGTLTHSGGNRTLTNSITSGKALTLAAVNLSTDATSRTLTITGSGSTIVNGIIANGGGSSAGGLIKSGTGTLTLNGANTYAGTTTVSAGKLFVNGSTGVGNVSVSANATLGGTGTIGGNTTVAANGRLEFNIGTNAANHDKLELASGRSLTFSGASTVTITSTPAVSPTLGTYTLLTAPGGITGPLPTLNYPSGWDAALTIVGNDLRLSINFTGIFPSNPTLVSIQDDQGGGPVYTNTTVTYTVTFSEDMNAATVTAADFGNAGSSTLSFGTITETTPGVFTVQVTPTTGSTLQLKINSGATLTSTAGLNLNTSSALLDNDTLSVQTPVAGVLTVSFGDFVSSGTRGGPFSPASKQYTITNNGISSINWTVAKTASWLDLSSTSGTLAAGANTTVTASINASANSLAITAYYDTLTFTNTTNGVGNTTRGAGLTVNGLPAQVTLANLSQTYDGTPKPVSVTTNPPSLTCSLTYNGLATVPTTAGSYDIVATINDPDYAGSATGTLDIAKAAQTINFAALSPIGNDQTTLALTATASSGLPVSYSSSNSSVATVSGSTLTITGVGTTTITASQAGNDNYEAAANVQRTLDVILTNPLAVPGGPYTVSSSANLVLNGSASIPSSNQTITAYEWDLNVNDNGGNFNVNVTGATPAPITIAVLQGSYLMVNGNNTIRLRVKDSANKTSAPVTATVTLIAPLLWDANNTAATQPDGAGGWLNTNQWWTGAANTTWLPDNVGKDVRFGNGGTGGAVALPAPTSVGSIIFNAFNGTYTLGSAAQTLTINGGITTSASSGIVTFPSPIVLGAAQTWTNNSSGALTLSSTLNNGGFTHTFDGTGTTNINRDLISGAGGIIMNGTGRLIISANPEPEHTFSGGLIVNQGLVMIQNFKMGTGNVTLNNGSLESYWSGKLTRALGSGPNQIQILGGISGFGGSNGGVTVRFTDNANYEVVWGSQFFNPSEFVLATPNVGSGLVFDNKLDLNGSTRTVRANNTGTAFGTLAQIIRNSSATPAGLIKTGPGRINLNAANTYNGGTTLQEGTLQLGNVSGLGASVGPLTVNAGLLNLNNIAAVTVGNLTGTGGTIANNGAGAITFTIGNGGGTGGNFQGVIADNTIAGTGTLALTKTGIGAITLSGTNTYTGITSINQGKLFINSSTAAGNVSVASGATFGGTGTIGGDTTIAAGGKLEFRLSSPAISHDPLNIASGKTLAFSGASELTITLASGAAPGTYVLVTGGNNITGIAPVTLNLPAGCLASVSIVGNELRLQVTSVGDIAPPTLLGIVDNQAGQPILLDTLVTYTVTFNEDINAASVSSADFANAGTSAITIGTITETSPGVFTLQATPTTAGTLRLRIPVSAVIQDTAGNALVTNPALDDDTIITVNAPPSNPYVAWSGGAAFNADSNNDGVSNGMAWLLGASGTSVNSLARLPMASQSSGNLTLTFTCLKVANRGGAALKVQYSRDFGVTDPWHEVTVPDTAGTAGIVNFTIPSTNPDPNLVNIQATIPASAATPGAKLFGRLSGVSAP